MKPRRKPAFPQPCRLLSVVVTFVICLLVSATSSNAQVTGGNKVYNSSGTCCAISSAFLDGSAFGVAGDDICTRINAALLYAQGHAASFPAGVVVDARGVLPSVGNPDAQQCSTTSPQPFNGVTIASTVLLPPLTIKIPKQWLLPDKTRIVGEGPNSILVAISGFISDSTNSIIEMCSTGTCTGVAVEHLKIDGNALNLNGIYNAGAQDSSYVNDVSLAGIVKTALVIAPGATDSGPYTNLWAGADKNSTTTNAACVKIQAQTRGLHGITCAGNGSVSGSAGKAAIYVSASNNSIEDAHVEGYHDGIQVLSPSTATPTGNVLIANMTGTGNGDQRGAVLEHYV